MCCLKWKRVSYKRHMVHRRVYGMAGCQAQIRLVSGRDSRTSSRSRLSGHCLSCGMTEQCRVRPMLASLHAALNFDSFCLLLLDAVCLHVTHIDARHCSLLSLCCLVKLNQHLTCNTNAKEKLQHASQIVQGRRGRWTNISFRS